MDRSTRIQLVWCAAVAAMGMAIPVIWHLYTVCFTPIDLSQGVSNLSVVVRQMGMLYRATVFGLILSAGAIFYGVVILARWFIGPGPDAPLW